MSFIGLKKKKKKNSPSNIDRKMTNPNEGLTVLEIRERFKELSITNTNAIVLREISLWMQITNNLPRSNRFVMTIENLANLLEELDL